MCNNLLAQTCSLVDTRRARVIIALHGKDEIIFAHAELFKPCRALSIQLGVIKDSCFGER